jgi:hypothetical protein
MKEISKQNTPLICCADQTQEQQQKITRKNFGQYRNHLIIWHMSGTMGAGLKEFYCI